MKGVRVLNKVQELIFELNQELYIEERYKRKLVNDSIFELKRNRDYYNLYKILLCRIYKKQINYVIKNGYICIPMTEVTKIAKSKCKVYRPFQFIIWMTNNNLSYGQRITDNKGKQVTCITVKFK
jgi:hypothetical protein